MKAKRRSLLSLNFILPNVVLFFVVWTTVELVYQYYVRPRVAELVLQRKIKMEAHYAPGRSMPGHEIESQPLLLIIKDREPQIEIVFFLWGIICLAYRAYVVHREQRLLEVDFVRIAPGEKILPDGALERFIELREATQHKKSWHGRILPSCILVALQRFHATGSVSEATVAVKDRAERIADELDSSLSLVRYIAWAIPAIGFVGTARGIGDALTFADQAVKGDIAAVTSWLGLAFNSTLVGLLLCIPLMYLLHVVQSTQEATILDIQAYCCDHVIDAMKLPAPVGDGRDDRESWGRPGAFE